MCPLSCDSCQAVSLSRLTADISINSPAIQVSLIQMASSSPAATSAPDNDSKSDDKAVIEAMNKAWVSTRIINKYASRILQFTSRITEVINNANDCYRRFYFMMLCI